jgi:hypothetical protein
MSSYVWYSELILDDLAVLTFLHTSKVITTTNPHDHLKRYEETWANGTYHRLTVQHISTSLHEEDMIPPVRE